MIRRCRGGGGPRSTGRLTAWVSPAAAVPPRHSGDRDGGGPGAADDAGGSKPVAAAGAVASASSSAGSPGGRSAGGSGACALAAATAGGVRSGAGSWLTLCGPLTGMAGNAGVPNGDGGSGGVGGGTPRGAGEAEADTAGKVDDGRAADLRGDATGGVAGGDSTDGRCDVPADGFPITSGNSVSTTSGGAVASTGGGPVGSGVGSAWAGSAPRDAPTATTPSVSARCQKLIPRILCRVEVASSTLHDPIHHIPQEPVPAVVTAELVVGCDAGLPHVAPPLPTLA
jgi:hypothetical protein